MPPAAAAPPPRQDIAAAWLGREMAQQPERWTITLSAQQIAELDGALAGVISGNRELAAITKAHFPLPTLGPVLAALREELIHGRGFALVRGLPAGGYTEEEAATIFFGLGSHLGHARSQNAAGDVLGHVRERAADLPHRFLRRRRPVVPAPGEDGRRVAALQRRCGL
jgi:hypothetical protein